MYVERETHGLSGAVPPHDFRDDELQLVQQPWAYRGVARPRLLVVVGQEIAHPKVLADWQVNVSLGDLEKPGRRLLVSGKLFREICPDAIAVQHGPFLFLERDEDGERQTINDSKLISTNEREAIKPGFD